MSRNRVAKLTATAALTMAAIAGGVAAPGVASASTGVHQTHPAGTAWTSVKPSHGTAWTSVKPSHGTAWTSVKPSRGTAWTSVKPSRGTAWTSVKPSHGTAWT